MARKVRDSGGVVRTITGFKVRDAGNVLRNLVGEKVRDAGNVLRDVFAAGAGVSVWISPSSTGTGSSVSSSDVSDFTVGYSGGTAPTAYAWVIESVKGGTAYIVSGAAAATARISVDAPDPGTVVEARIRCDITIGTVYPAWCTKSHAHLGPQ